ncbi:MAG: hypothetical protein Fur0010_10980 [Bdellovibrio sp.]
MEQSMNWVPGFDFEQKLFSKNTDSSKSSEEFDYLILWLESEGLISSFKFENEYLNYLGAFLGHKPQVLTDSPEKKLWWGSTLDLEKSRKLNSKIFSLEIAKKFNISHPLAIVISSIEEIKIHIKNNPEIEKWVLKNPYLYSGIGNQVFESGKNPKLQTGELYILEPWLKRTMDVGITFLKDQDFDQYFGVLNLNDQMGRFKGALIQSKLPEVNEIASVLGPIINELKLMEPEDNLQIDNFYYLENGERKLYPLVEINCRKTMGYVTWKLWKKFADQKIGVFLLFNNKDLKIKNLQDLERRNYSYNEKNRNGFLYLSPPGKTFQSVFLVDSSIKQAQSKIVELWKEISKEGRSLPLEFMIYF